jgi:hypothetical protein
MQPFACPFVAFLKFSVSHAKFALSVCVRTGSVHVHPERICMHLLHSIINGVFKSDPRANDEMPKGRDCNANVVVSRSVAHRFPEIVNKLVILNCPHPKFVSLQF